MYRKTQPRIHLSAADLRFQRQVLLIVCAVLIVALIALGIIAVRNAGYQGRVRVQLNQRMYSASVSAMDEVNRMGGIITSNAPARLGRVRQYIYYMEQLNSMSISLAGGESGRLVQDDAFVALYQDLENFENVLQQSTSSTLDARTILTAHLTALQATLGQQ